MLKTTSQIRANWNNVLSKGVEAALAAAKWIFFQDFSPSLSQLRISCLFFYWWRSADVPAVPDVHPVLHLSTSPSPRPLSHGRTHININDTARPLMWNNTAWRTAVTDKPAGIKGQRELDETSIYSEIKLCKANILHNYWLHSVILPKNCNDTLWSALFKITTHVSCHQT